ncbi:MAG: hypothetical protein LBR07_06680 [Puniceicoccales bacterium]|jgi:hypothetical protein|nr:hypothetical protein [Puniceicoccales bacterium]
MGRAEDQRRVWRVNWKGAISGPFSTDELREKLRLGEISLLHRVAAADGRWRPLSEALEEAAAAAKKTSAGSGHGAGGERPRLAKPPPATTPPEDAFPEALPPPLPPPPPPVTQPPPAAAVAAPEAPTISDADGVATGAGGRAVRDAHALHYDRDLRDERAGGGRGRRGSTGSFAAGGTGAGDDSGRTVLVGYVLCGLSSLLPVLLTTPAIFTALWLRRVGRRDHAKIQIWLTGIFSVFGILFWVLILNWMWWQGWF